MARAKVAKNPWKWATLGILGVLFIALVTGVVVATYSADETTSQAAPAPKSHSQVASQSAPAQPKEPSRSVIEDCNRYAANHRSEAREAAKNGVIGGAVGAGVGAASGAIAGGGSGAGKGAGIGGLVGAAVGTLYGLNEANRANDAAELAYRDCMRRNGYGQ